MRHTRMELWLAIATLALNRALNLAIKRRDAETVRQIMAATQAMLPKEPA